VEACYDAVLLAADFSPARQYSAARRVLLSSIRLSSASNSHFGRPALIGEVSAPHPIMSDERSLPRRLAGGRHCKSIDRPSRSTGYRVLKQFHFGQNALQSLECGVTSPPECC
jgi:hypothetical protein